MTDKASHEIFKKSSQTFYYSNLLFPKHTRDQVATLYAFLRTVDDFADELPQRPEEYQAFKRDYYQALQGQDSGNSIIDSYVALRNEKELDDSWIEALFLSMEMDMTLTTYTTMDDTLRYIYGAAEIVGLLMAKVLDLPQSAFHAAQYFGRAAQYCNMIRDIHEDLELGRVYFPNTELQKYNLQSLQLEYTSKHSANFIQFIQAQISIYFDWYTQGQKGFVYIPKKLRIGIETAGKLHNWTMQTILNNPFIIYQKKVKPQKKRILLTALQSIL